jgi:parallel beta-helix repeat protein
VNASDQNDHVFEVTRNYVNISGFTVANATGDYRAGIYLNNAEHCTISENTASNNYYGIEVYWGSTLNNLTGNTANSNNDYGIYLSSSSYNNLTGNTANSNNDYGIYLSSSSYNNLTDNTMADNRYNFGIWGSALSDFIQYMDTSNTVDGKPVYYWLDKQNDTVPSNAGYVGIVNSTNITVKNILTQKNGQGVLFAYTDDSRIENVTASNNRYGISLYSSSNNNLTGNTANSNTEWGIYLDSSRGNYITNNTCTYNGFPSGNYDGIGLKYYSDDNTIVNNNCSSNGWAGIYLGEYSSTNNVTNNTCTNNTEGIQLWKASDNVLTNNKVSDNDYGVYLEISNNNMLTNNTASNNDNGIYLEDSNNNWIIGNDLLDNQGLVFSGIHLDSDSWSTVIHFNNIVGNVVYGVYNENTLEEVNATHNWWGDVSGPSGVGYGAGDAVSGNVNYDPWLDAPYLGGEPINFTSAKTETVPAGTTEIDAKTEADTIVTINTTASVNVTVAEYSRNPGTGFGGDSGKYIDVHVNDTTNVTSLTIKLFYTDADIVGLNENTLRMQWWNGTTGEWIACSNTGVNTTDQNGYRGYIWAYIDDTTIPSLSDLTGSPFGGRGSPERVPVLTPIGKLGLIGMLSAIAAVTITKRRKRR